MERAEIIFVIKITNLLTLINTVTGAENYGIFWEVLEGVPRFIESHLIDSHFIDNHLIEIPFDRFPLHRKPFHRNFALFKINF